MTKSPQKRGRLAAGLTYLELSIVIGVILSLASVTFAGANAWKNGSSRSRCVINIRNVQQAVRSYQNVHGYNPGDTINAFNGSQSIAGQLYEIEYIRGTTYDQIRGTEPCPGGGTYSTTCESRFPKAGHLFITCSLADSQNHVPAPIHDW